MKLKLDDCEIAYDYVSAGDEQAPVLFMHGALGVRGQFDGLRAQFPERSHIALDFPSHGDSSVTSGAFNSERLARHVLALLDALNIDKVDIIGHSMGGYVGLVMAHLAPARVKRIVTVGTKFYWSEEVIAATARELDATALKARSQRYYDALAATHTACGADETLRLTQGLIEDFGRWQLSEDMVRLSDVPLLICAGDRDTMVPVDEVARLFRATDVKRNAFAILPGTPHPLQQLPIECFAQIVRRFWQTASAK